MNSPDASVRLPTYFISHGGGPWPWLTDQMPGDWGPLTRSLEDIPRHLGTPPRAILMVSAHWETPEFTVQTHPNPPMLYDYGGFPEFTYQVQYPAPGAPDVAERVAELLGGAGFPVQRDGTRGFDHGVFAPLVVAYPDADVPVVQLSIKHSFDPAEHLAAGRAIAPLRDEGVLIVGSGFTYHNLRNFGPGAAVPSREFDAWLSAAMAAPSSERSRLLTEWEAAPSARAAHPREDHLIPLMVAVGAAEQEPADRYYHETTFMNHITSSSFRIGAAPASEQ
ncbi:MAG TPA: class III extradiol ring-cleavage dioxygenase [Ilumatobacter sp.]|nr:class III extradiol ring-cleavage dioxygenase [Ilumatobacter sp.]